MKKTIISIVIAWILAFIIGLGIFATIVYADTLDPDSVTIDDIYINRNLLETGDVLIYFTPNVAYGTSPGDPIDDTFTFRLIDTDNVTVLATRDAYDFVNDGYGPTVLSFYFTAADNLTWGQAYTIRISGKPSMFDDPPVYDFPIATSDYTSQTTQQANEDETENNIVNIAQDLSTSMSVDLLSEGDIVTVLSSDGEELFRSTIPGLQAMCPDIFSVIVYEPNYTPRAWTGNLSANYTATYTGQERAAVSNFWGDMFNLNFSLSATMPIIVLCVIMIIASAKMNNQVYSGLLNSSACVILAAPAGWMPMAIVSIGALTLTFYSSMRLFLKG